MSATIAMFAFGSFELDTASRQLRRDGTPISLSSRAFDILVMLIECHDRVVTKDEIMSRVWRGMIVEENNLAVQISALRRALADGAERPSMIMTVPGQGYRFVDTWRSRVARRQGWPRPRPMRKWPHFPPPCHHLACPLRPRAQGVPAAGSTWPFWLPCWQQCS